MQSLYILIPIAIIFSFLALALFVWSINGKQFEDLERESSRILELDDTDISPPQKKQNITLANEPDSDSDSDSDKADNHGI